MRGRVGRAALLCRALELPGIDECPEVTSRHWWGQGHEIPERSAQRILKAADQILKGRDGSGGALMTAPDPRLRQLVDELANALQTATLIAGQFRQDLGARVQDAEAVAAGPRTGGHGTAGSFEMGCES